MRTPTKDYKPYGDEWKKHVMQMSKAEIIELFAGACTSKDEQIQQLEEALKKLIDYADKLYTWADMPREDYSGTQIAKAKSLLK